MGRLTTFFLILCLFLAGYAPQMDEWVVKNRPREEVLSMGYVPCKNCKP